GTAFYGRSFTLKQNTSQPVWSQATGTGKSLTYDRLKAVLDNAKTGFDEQAKAPYATDGTTFWTYDDPVSIHYKGAYAVENNLMGLMCWEYGGDSSGELLTAMHESLSGALTVQP
ncbi:MAG: glycosyl hydrolase family 18 protein, partial [Candidatus Limiplasma sp.]|nr:glycosyl hydrolase family 18 protein [Candidatus Limiplasma sp.]